MYVRDWLINKMLIINVLKQFNKFHFWGLPGYNLRTPILKIKIFVGNRNEINPKYLFLFEKEIVDFSGKIGVK